jgi:hypothetical protein
VLHTLSRNRRAAAALVVLALSLSACTTWVVQTGPPREVLLSHPTGNVQVRKTDGSRQNLLAAFVDNDAIVGFRTISQPKEGAVLHQRQYETRYDTITIPLSQVEALAVAKGSPIRTVGILSILAASLGAVLGSAGSTN